jgi:hypothetical protein
MSVPELKQKKIARDAAAAKLAIKNAKDAEVVSNLFIKIY